MTHQLKKYPIRHPGTTQKAAMPSEKAVPTRPSVTQPDSEEAEAEMAVTHEPIPLLARR
jgi:hypothetical protein